MQENPPSQSLSILVFKAGHGAGAKRLNQLTPLQRDLTRAAAEPTLWVDIRGDVATGQALVLLLGNSGTSLARNVKVTFDPAPPSTRDIKEVLEILERGIAAVAPGRELEWVLGAAHNTVDWKVRNEYKVRIEGEGPFGPLEPVEFVIVVNDLKGSHAAAAGNLRAVALQIQEFAKAAKPAERVDQEASAGRVAHTDGARGNQTVH